MFQSVASIRSATLLAAFSCLVAAIAHAEPLPDAAASDPVSLGWMQGTPPPPAKLIRTSDGSFYRFPHTRWSFSHWRELFPSSNVSRGEGPVAPLPRANKPAELDAVSFTRTTGGEPMTFAQALPALYTDGIVVLHRGRIVYEKYFGALDERRPHIAFSVTKSFFGTLGAMLVAEGALDENAPVSRYIPELADSGFADATVRQVLDMTTALDYSEEYGNPKSSFVQYARAVGMFPYPPGVTGPDDVYSYLRTLPKAGTHGERFAYRSPNTDVVGWLVARATGRRPEVVLQERLWSQLGAEADAYMALDRAGNATAAGGFNARLRDFARFGEMMRLGGKLNGRQVVPAAVVARIRQGADREAFAQAGFDTLRGWSYRDQWWISHDDHGVFMARGIHGQAIFVDPKAEMVIARFSSHPVAATVTFDPIVLPAYRAVAEHLMTR
ncbi:MAG TPA: serine hydrolase [Steroidobacteraceae bacterium]|nr:serine hydrolase [Steroidobacteraceae bacterium]